MSLWIEPELVRRGMNVDGSALAKAVVVMTPGRPVEVRINDEADWVAHLPALRAIEKGEAVTTADVDLSQLEWLRPAGVDHDAGWTGFVRIGDEVLISFDFRRNRARARAMLPLAREFLGTARMAREQSLLRPAVENLYAAAELAVVVADVPARRFADAQPHPAPAAVAQLDRAGQCAGGPQPLPRSAREGSGAGALRGRTTVHQGCRV